MTVQSTITDKTFYPGAALATQSLAGLIFVDPAELQVFILLADGRLSTLLTLGTHYSLSGNGAEGAASITPLSARDPAERWYVRRVTAVLQPIAFPLKQPLSSDSLQQLADRLTRISQEHRRELGRAALVPPGETGPLFVGLGSAANNAVLAYDAATGSFKPVGDANWIAWRDAARADIEAKGDEQVGLVEAAGENIIDAVGAVVQRIPFAFQYDDGLIEDAWYVEFFAPTTTTYTEWNASIFVGSGSVDLLVNVNDVNVYGPRTITSGVADSDAPALTIAKGSRVSIQMQNIVGTPKLIAGQLLGYPS